MPIDASIYRGIQQPQAPDQLANYGRMLQIRQMMDQGELAGLQRQQLTSDMEEQRAARDVLSRADWAKPEMVINDVMKVAPKTGLQMRKDYIAQQADQSKIDNNRSQIDQRNWQLQRDRTEYMIQQFSPMLTEYNNLVGRGATPEQALAAIQPKYQMARGGMVNSGMFPAQAVAQLPEQFDPSFVGSNLMATLKYKDQLEQQRRDAEFKGTQANQVMIPDGKGGFKVNQPLVDAKGAIAQRGAPVVSVNTDKSFFGEVANKLGAQVANGVEQARAAVGTIATVGRLRQALDSGNITAGPGATAVQVLGQVGQVLGVNGQDATERLVNTRQAIRELAKLELDGAAQLRGQGQITEGERALVKRAESGDIDSMTVPELRLLMDTLDKTARFKIKQNASVVERMKGNPKAGDMVQFMQVDMPPEYAPPQRPAQPAQQGQPVAPKPIAQFDSLPDPAQFNGKEMSVSEGNTVQWFKSDGKSWRKITK